MTDPNPDDAARSVRKEWTAAYRIPIAVTTGLLYLLCAWALITGSATEKWAGGIGLTLLVAWIFVFQALRRRGY